MKNTTTQIVSFFCLIFIATVSVFAGGTYSPTTTSSGVPPASCATGFAVQNTTTGGVDCISLNSAGEPLFESQNATLARTGVCPAGQVVQNTTIGGVQCVSSSINNNITGSGTTGYIPQWQNGTHLNNSVLYQNGNFIGIGTTVPLTDLNIKSDKSEQKEILVWVTNESTSSAGSVLTLQVGTKSGAFQIKGSNANNANLQQVPNSMLIRGGSQTTGGTIIGQSATAPIIFYSGGFAFSNEKMRIDTTGNLNIPSDSTKIQLGSSQSATIGYNGTNLNINPRAVGTGNTVFTSGSVGIGTAPTANLHIANSTTNFITLQEPINSYTANINVVRQTVLNPAPTPTLYLEGGFNDGYYSPIWLGAAGTYVFGAKKLGNNAQTMTAGAVSYSNWTHTHCETQSGSTCYDILQWIGDVGRVRLGGTNSGGAEVYMHTTKVAEFSSTNKFYVNTQIPSDSVKLQLGSSQNAEVYYDGSNLQINPKAVGTGSTLLNGNTGFQSTKAESILDINGSSVLHYPTGTKATNTGNQLGSKYFIAGSDSVGNIIITCYSIVEQTNGVIKFVAAFDNPYICYDVKYANGYIYQAAQTGGLKIWKVNSWTNITEVGNVLVGSWTTSVAINGNYLYGGSGLGTTVFDITNPVNPTQVAHIDDFTYPNVIKFRGNKMLIRGGAGLLPEGWALYDNTNPLNPQKIYNTSYTYTAGLMDLTDTLVLGHNTTGVIVYDLSNTSNIQISYPSNYSSAAGGPRAIKVSGSNVYALYYNAGNYMEINTLYINGTQVQYRGNITVGGSSDGEPAIFGNYMFIPSSNSQGMQVVRLEGITTSGVTTASLEAGQTRITSRLYVTDIAQFDTGILSTGAISGQGGLFVANKINTTNPAAILRGQVGINTTVPQQTFNVVGSSLFNGTITAFNATITNLSGTGNATVCVDSQGRLYRGSSTGC